MLKPTSDRVLLKEVMPESVSKGGIIIPVGAQEKTLTGIVVSVGPEVPEGNISAGDKVMYDKYAGTQVKENGEDHIIVRFPDILVVISE